MHNEMHYRSTRCCINQMYDVFIVVTHTCTHPKGWTSRHTNICIPRCCTQKCPHPLQTIRQHSQTYTPFPPDCRHSTPSTAVKTQGLPTLQYLDGLGGLEKDRARRRHVMDAELTLLDNSHSPHRAFAGWIHIPCIASFFLPLSTPFCHSSYSPLCLMISLSFPQSTSTSLLLQARFHCCLTSALITAPGSPPSTSRLACESTCPRAVITLKSSKSGHVKLREVFREPTQVSERVSWKLAQGRICMSKHTPWFRLHHKMGLKISCSL